MSDRLAPIAHDDLEARLADLATALSFPTTPDLAGAVGARLRAAHRRPQPIRRSVPRSLLLAATLAVLVVGGALAVRFGLELLSIQFGPIPSIAPSLGAGSTEPPGSSLRLGQPLTLDEASGAAAFDLLVPTEPGPPDVVYLGGLTLRGQVAFVYAPRDGLPASGLLHGAGMLITQNLGEPDDGLAHKLVQTGEATVEQVVVNGAPGVWITGPPHFFWYMAPDGTLIEDSRRFVGDTLAWERDGILYRIEGEITREYALEVARSMR